MQKILLNLKLIVSLIVFSFAVIAPGLALGNKPFPTEVTVAVDCAAGDSITKALKKPADLLIIEISGMCAEDVKILRNNVILRGTDNTIDGITVPDVDHDRVLVIFGANTIGIENLTLTGARFGLSMNATFGVNVQNVNITETTFGVIAGSSSGSINFDNTEISSSFFGSRGLWAAGGSQVRCSECTIDNFSRGVIATQGSEILLWGTTVQNTRTAVTLQGGSRIEAIQRCFDFPTCLVPTPIPGNLGGSRFLLDLLGTSSAFVGNSTLSGRLNLREKSVVTMQGVTHSLSSGSNSLDGASSVILENGSTLQGDVQIHNFSNLSLTGGSTITGVLNCSAGGDAYCNDGNDVTGGSNCDKCISPPTP